uniref:ARAD1C01584p n=1 Tax=Blastobotrys adeninivorans TaxID=409370 RepID=A0A060T4Y0_BLAAD
MLHSSENNDERVRVALSDEPLDAAEAITFVKSPDAGAVVYFGGTTRDSMDGKEVVHLAYDAYIALALKTLDRVAREALDKWSKDRNPNKYISKVSITHRLGVVPVMQESVVIALSAGHRQEGWAAGEWILEQIKALAEIWKDERYADGSHTWRDNRTDSDMLNKS